MTRERHRFPISPVIRELTGVDLPDLAERDGWKTVPCPFHQEQRPSARISRYGFICNACDYRGDAIKLIQKEEDVAFKAAVDRASAICGGTGGEVPRRGWGGLQLSQQ